VAAEVMSVGVIGAGTMGAGIAHAFLTTGSSVYLAETDDRQRASAAARIVAVIDRGIERGVLDAAAAEVAKGRLVAVAGVEHFPAGIDLIVEAVPEIPDLKALVLAVAESRRPVVLASNTSSISIDRLADALERPDRFVGMHFFNPVWSMKLVEIIVGPRTAQSTTDTAIAVVERLGKQPVVVTDTPGFASTRLGVLLGLEAIRMLEQGVASAEDIDKAMTLGYGHPMGPLRLTDLVGLDVRLAIADHLAGFYGDRFAPPQLLRDMVASGRTGKKAGQGFYTWSTPGASGDSEAAVEP
jgi:3-hydroxybutyryl-CoA dehydrogenase